MRPIIAYFVAALTVGGLACGTQQVETPAPAGDAEAATPACDALFAYTDRESEREGVEKGLDSAGVEANKLAIRTKIHDSAAANGQSTERLCQTLLDEFRRRDAEKQALEDSADAFTADLADPMGAALGHQEAMLGILEDNADNPDEAGLLMKAYYARHRDEFARINASSEKLEAKANEDPLGAMAMFAKHADRLRAVAERTRKLDAANPDLLTNANVHEAMSALR